MFACQILAGEFETKRLQRDLIMIEITTDGKLIWATFDNELYCSDDDSLEEYSKRFI
ncbi:hypothetical protein Q0590_32650 [Rhodocytophaga aerolata]|uniref:Uncharacterized protein n=1 Tax=Rhodocytophaga aerolata TaxID=455078 RepID=A0ABT8RG28_9BACT|nr:hypothetical protein [Rhodocytophaga aerolata]MDO1451070.1 hypothetical protein [Rhodocytophaga aerolata]